MVDGAGLAGASEYTLWQVLAFKATMCRDKPGQLTVLLTQVEGLITNFFSLLDASCSLSMDGIRWSQKDMSSILVPTRVSGLLGFPEGTTPSIAVSNPVAFDQMLLGHRTEFPQEDQLKNFDLPTSENLKVEVDAIKDIKLEAVDDYDDLNQQDDYTESPSAVLEVKYDIGQESVAVSSGKDKGGLWHPDFPVSRDVFYEMKNGLLERRCPTCQILCKTMAGLRKHWKLKRCNAPEGISFREIPSDVEGVSKMYICTVPGCPRADMKWRQKTNIFLHHSEVHATPDQLKFSCSFCHKEFISQTILNLHIHSIHKRERERASKPGAKEKKPRDMTLPYLRKEMRIYQPDHYPMDLDTFNQMKAGVLPKVCPLCGMTFDTLHGMTRHFIYKRCRKNILPPNMEFEEIKDETKEKGFKYICKWPGCPTVEMGKVWSNRYAFHSHWNNEHAAPEDLTVACNQCPKRFITSVLLKVHERSKHPKQDGQVYTCSFCGKVFTNFKSLQGHEKTHRRKNQNVELKCELCSYTTLVESHLKGHIRYNHPEAINAQPIKKNHVCDQCGKGFRTAAALGEHSWTHSTQPHPQFQCPICHKYMKQANSFRKHMSNVHKVHHSCKDCPKSFPTETGLIQHRNKVHGSLLIS